MKERTRPLALVLCIALALSLWTHTAFAMAEEGEAPAAPAPAGFQDSGPAEEVPDTAVLAGVPAPQADVVTTPLNFTNVGDGAGQTPAQGPGYQWSGDRESGYLLELTDFHMELVKGQYSPSVNHIIKLPNDGKVTVQLTGDNVINVEDPWNGITVENPTEQSNLVVDGKGSGSLTYTGASGPFGYCPFGTTIKDVTIQADTPQGGIVTSSYDINEGKEKLLLDNVVMNLTTQGNSAGAIVLYRGDCIIKNSTVNLNSVTDIGIQLNDGNLEITNSKLTIDAFLYGVYVKDGDITITDSEVTVTSEGVRGIHLEDGNTADPTHQITLSGNTTASVSSATGYGIRGVAGLTIESPARLTVSGSTTNGAIGTFGEISLQGVAVTSPVSGMITPPGEDNSSYTIRSGEALAAVVEIGPVALTVTPDKMEYLQGAIAQVNVTTVPDLSDSDVSIYMDERLLGTGKLGVPISIDTTQLPTGTQILTAKLHKTKGNVLEEFSITIREPLSIADAEITLEPVAFRYDGTPHSPVISGVKLGETMLTADVDYTAVIPREKEPGTYTVTITGKGNYTGTAAATFTINPVKTEDVILPNGNQVQLTVENGLTSVPEGLRNTPFLTVPAIEMELRTKVTAALPDVGEQIAIYDVRLQYLDNGVWKDVDPDDFPAGGVTAVLPYPDGTNGNDYTFTVQHMISHGNRAGEVETLNHTAIPDGLQCRFTSLSPVAVGYKTAEKRPSGGGGGSDSGDDDHDFWQRVQQRIQEAKQRDTVTVNAQGYDEMPWTVMDALKKSNSVSLVIRWSGGEITIPAGKAPTPEPGRIYYPLSYLASLDFGTATGSNPETGGPAAGAFPLEPAPAQPPAPSQPEAKSPPAEPAAPVSAQAAEEEPRPAKAEKNSALPLAGILAAALAAGAVLSRRRKN